MAYKLYVNDKLFQIIKDNIIINKGSITLGQNTYDFDNSVGSGNTLTDIILSYVNQLMEDTPASTPAWNAEGTKNRWNYIDGVFMYSLLSLYNQSSEAKYKDFFINYIDYYINDNGQFVNPLTKAASYAATELDSVCESRILFDAYQLTKDERYLTAIEFTYNTLINTANVPITTNGINFSHKLSYANQVWCDGFYMYLPFLSRYALLHNNPTVTIGTNTAPLFDLIKLQLQYVREHMKDESGLYRHAHDTKVISGGTKEFWADSVTGNSANVWLRATCWLFVALCDMLEFFPEGADKDYILEMFQELAASMLPYKDAATNMFYQLPVLAPSTTSGSKTNYLESSGSSMIAYAYLKGARLGYLDSSYLTTGGNIFLGTFNHSLYDTDTNGEITESTTSIQLGDICITAGMPNTGATSSNAAGKDGSIKYYLEVATVGEADAKGTGPFIMAFTQYREKNTKVNKVQFIDDNNSIIDHVAYIDNGNKVLAPTILPEFYPDGCLLQGWLLDGKPFDFANTAVLSDIVLTPNWVVPTYHTVTFEVNGGTSLPAEQVIDGFAYTAPEPSYAGHSFEGWYLDNAFASPFIENSIVSSSITLYAKWAEITSVIWSADDIAEGTTYAKNSTVADNIAFTFNTVNSASIVDGFVDDGTTYDYGLLPAGSSSATNCYNLVSKTSGTITIDWCLSDSGFPTKSSLKAGNLIVDGTTKQSVTSGTAMSSYNLAVTAETTYKLYCSSGRLVIYGLIFN